MEFHNYSQQQVISSSVWEIINYGIEKYSNLICKSLLWLCSCWAHDNITKQWPPLTVYQIEFSSLTTKGKYPLLVDVKQLLIWKCFDRSRWLKSHFTVVVFSCIIYNYIQLGPQILGHKFHHFGCKMFGTPQQRTWNETIKTCFKCRLSALIWV